MKGIIVILLLAIVGGVGYLAYSEYRQQQAAADLAARISDPDGYVAREWAKRARLECTSISDVVAVDTPSGVRRPTEFTCYHSRTGTWRITDRACGKNEPEFAAGPPRADGQV